MLRSIIQRLFGRTRAPVTDAAARLAKDLRVPTDAAQAAIADVRKAPTMRAGPRVFLLRARQAMRKLQSGEPLSYSEEVRLAQFLERMPLRDYQILRHSKEGRTFPEIAEIMRTDVDSVMESLVKTYADMSMWMMGAPDPDGGGGLAPEAVSAEMGRKVAAG